MPATTSSDGSISIYTGALTARIVVECVKKIKQAFPTLPQGWYDILSERIKENKFTDERLKDSVNYVIDNCPYPTPSIAQFISWDKRIKTYTYAEYCDLCDKGCGSEYEAVKLPGREKHVWIHVNDVKTFYSIIDEK